MPPCIPPPSYLLLGMNSWLPAPCPSAHSPHPLTFCSHSLTNTKGHAPRCLPPSSRDSNGIAPVSRGMDAVVTRYPHPGPGLWHREGWKSQYGTHMGLPIWVVWVLFAALGGQWQFWWKILLEVPSHLFLDPSKESILAQRLQSLHGWGWLTHRKGRWISLPCAAVCHSDYWQERILGFSCQPPLALLWLTVVSYSFICMSEMFACFFV